MKPEAPVEYRGSFGVTKTKNGDVFSDNFPKTAEVADKITVIRSLVGRIPDHAQATYGPSHKICPIGLDEKRGRDDTCRS